VIVGIGVDLVEISELRRLAELDNGVFVKRTFTQKEIAEAEASHDKMAHLATRFAAKEAVFKAVAHHTKEQGFDFRIVETLGEPDGYPRVHPDEKLRSLMDEAGISNLLLSLSTEGGFAIAMVVADSG